jgi:hypothetical protein
LWLTNRLSSGAKEEGFTTDLMNEVNQVLVLNKLSTLRFLTPLVGCQHFLKNKIKETLKAQNEISMRHMRYQ